MKSDIYNKYVEIGRVVFISSGKDEGKLAVIVNVIDGNKVMVDGPSTGVARSVRNLKDLQLTKFNVPVRVGMRTGGVKTAFDQAGVAEKWQETSLAKNNEKRKLRANLTDFERFKVQVAKRMRNNIVDFEMKKLKRVKKVKKSEEKKSAAT